MKPMFDKRHDLEGNELSRVGKTALFSKFIPVGNLGGGPGARCLVILAVLHYFGGGIYWVHAKYGHRLQLFHRLASKFRQ